MAKEVEKQELKKYLFWIIMGALVLTSFFILKPYLIAIMSAFILAYIALPLYKKLNTKLSNDTSAIICIAIIILIIIIPLSLIFSQLINQTLTFVKADSAKEIIQSLSELPYLNQIDTDLSEVANQIASWALTLFTNTVQEIPSLMITLLILIFGIFYILKDWDKLTKELQKYIPFKNKKEISKEIAKATNNIIYGSLLIAALEFIVAIIGFSILGLDFSFIFAILIAVLAFIPGLGSTIVWVPIAIYYLVINNLPNAIGVLIIGAIISIGIDTLARPKFLGSKTQVNPFIMLLGILGGISLFGIFGFIIGPLILIYTIKILQEIIE